MKRKLVMDGIMLAALISAAFVIFVIVIVRWRRAQSHRSHRWWKPYRKGTTSRRSRSAVR